jgi:hypothetical protein
LSAPPEALGGGAAEGDEFDVVFGDEGWEAGGGAGEEEGLEAIPSRLWIGDCGLRIGRGLRRLVGEAHGGGGVEGEDDPGELAIDGGVAEDGAGEGEDGDEDGEGAEENEEPAEGDGIAADFAAVEEGHEQGQGERDEEDQPGGVVSSEAQGGGGHVDCGMRILDCGLVSENCVEKSFD